MRFNTLYRATASITYGYSLYEEGLPARRHGQGALAHSVVLRWGPTAPEAQGSPLARGCSSSGLRATALPQPELMGDGCQNGSTEAYGAGITLLMALLIMTTQARRRQGPPEGVVPREHRQPVPERSGEVRHLPPNQHDDHTGQQLERECASNSLPPAYVIAAVIVCNSDCNRM